ncbi:hypothetical protein FDP25_05915 [Roseovarius sp. A21]|uniref:Uncharacterized protein n=1 Tax=Roseovarius bejariae TaxID=2576383 RepID=A0A844CJW6_9RHOB|nr:hypothetical protein [Roseovarius bejariae]MRU14962.1 hypothetical protein [Roseovarius bejariae]
MVEEAAYNIWKQATPARQARYMALSKDGRTELDRLLAQNAASAFMSDIERSLSKARSGVEAFQEAASELSIVVEARQALYKQGEARILAWLRKGTVVAVAYEAPRKLSDLPAEVPAEVICAAKSLDWETGTLKVSGLHLVELRFLPSQYAEEIRAVVPPATDVRASNQAETEPSEPTRPVGRPAIGPFIEEAFRALLKAGEIDLSTSMTSHYPLVRKWLENVRPEVITQPGMPGDEAIRKTISPLFKDAKKRSN